MIGKIMSEAAHSIIGMLSAKPVRMEHGTSNSDFGSLLQSPEDQPHSAAERIEAELPEAEISIRDDANSAVAPNMGAEIILPNIFQNLAIPARPQQSSSSDLEPQEKTTEVTAVGTQKLVPDRVGIDGLTAGTKGVDRSLDPKTMRDAIGPAIPTAIDRQGKSDKTEPVMTARSAIESGDADQPTAGIALGTPRTTGNQEAGEILADDPMPASLLPLRPQEKASRGTVSPLLDRAFSKGLDTGDYGMVAPFSKAELGQPGSTPGPLAMVPTSLSMGKAADSASQAFDTGKLNPQTPAKAFELPLDLPPVASHATQPAVREAAQAAVSFDLTAPRIAERLATEIAVLSVSGETKKFEINPRNLGRMEIMFTTRGSTEIIEIQTEHRSAKDIIVQHSQALQEMLKSQGRDDLTFRVDVKENMLSSSRSDNGNQFQQESRDTREHQSRSTRSGRTLPAFDGAPDSERASDNSRYA